MSKDLLKRAEEEITVLKLAVESLGYLQIEEDNALKFIALIQELLDKLKGDAERLESDKLAKLLEKVVKLANEGSEKRMNDINLTFGTDEKNNFKHDDTFVKFSQCAIHAQAAINIITDKNNGK